MPKQDSPTAHIEETRDRIASLRMSLSYAVSQEKWEACCKYSTCLAVLCERLSHLEAAVKQLTPES